LCVIVQSEIFPDKNQGGRTFYNEAIMSAMKIPQVKLYKEARHVLKQLDKDKIHATYPESM